MSKFAFHRDDGPNYDKNGVKNPDKGHYGWDSEGGVYKAHNPLDTAHDMKDLGWKLKKVHKGGVQEWHNEHWGTALNAEAQHEGEAMMKFLPVRKKIGLD